MGKKKRGSGRNRGGNAKAVGFRLREEVGTFKETTSVVEDPRTVGLDGLRAMFGSLDRNLVDSVVQRNNGDLEKCVLELSLAESPGPREDTRHQARESPWDMLPDDCKCIIFDFLSTIDKARAARTSKEFWQMAKAANWAQLIRCSRSTRLKSVRAMVKAFKDSYRLKVDYDGWTSSDPLEFYAAVRRGQDDRWATPEASPVGIENVVISGHGDFTLDELSCMLDQLLYIRHLTLKSCQNIRDEDLHVLANYKALSNRPEDEFQQSYTSLETLEITGSKLSSKGLMELISSHSAPRRLLFLDVSSSKKLTKLTPPRPGSFLRGMTAKSCPGLEAVDLIVDERCHLSDLNLSECLNLKEVRVKAGRLRSLNLSGCRSLKSLCVDTPMLSKLQAAKCSQLQIPGAGVHSLSCPRVKHISLNACREIQDEGLNLLLRHLKLQSLDIGGCIRVANLQATFDDLPNCFFHAYGCSSLKRLEIHCSAALEQVVLTGCSSLEVSDIFGPHPKKMLA